MAKGDWQRLALRDILSESSKRIAVDADRSYSNLGVYSYGRGVFAKEPIQGSTTAAPALYRVRAGQFIYSKLFAFEGAFGLVPPEMDGWFVSNEYPTFDVDGSRAIGEFLRIAMQRPWVWAKLAAMTVGMGHRRQRLHADAFLEYEMDVPPLEEQRSIVRALDVVERAVDGYASERDAARSLLHVTREELLRTMDVSQLGDVLKDIQAGKSPQAFDRPPKEGERGVLKVSAIRPGDFRPGETKAVPGHVVFPRHASVCHGDVLISRTNTRQLVGSVCRVEVQPQQLFLSDKTLRLIPDEGRVDPAFLVHSLASSTAREQIEQAATGTSESMKNISQRAIADMYVPMPDSLDEQRAGAATLDEIARVTREAQRLVECTQNLRAALVEAVLSGEWRVRDESDAVKELATA